MAQNSESPAAMGALAGPDGRSLLGGENNPETTPIQSQPQPVNAPATAPELLDLLYLNVVLELRLGAVKAIQAAVDFEIGDADEVAERNMLVADGCLKEALAKFDRIKEAKVAVGAAIFARELFSADAS